MTKHSPETLQGYNDCAVGISRSRNPFQAGAGSWTLERIAADPVNHKLHQKYVDWLCGWGVRFHGEDINEPIHDGG